MNNNQNSIKNIIRKYFVTGDSDIKKLPTNQPTQKTTYSPKGYLYKKKDITTNVENPEIARAMKALQLSNPFRGV